MGEWSGRLRTDDELETSLVQPIPGKKQKQSVAGRKSRFNGRGIRRFLPVAAARLVFGLESPDEKKTRDEQRRPSRPKVSLLRDSLGFSLYWHSGFTSVPATISIDTRVKTSRPPAADQRRTAEIDARAASNRLEDRTTNKAFPIDDLLRPIFIPIVVVVIFFVDRRYRRRRRRRHRYRHRRQAFANRYGRKGQGDSFVSTAPCRNSY